MKLTQDRLKELINYSPETGLFRWIYARGGALGGEECGSKTKIGYINIFIDYKIHSAHRLAFLWMTGDIPEFVDHINGIRDDNRWCNLRPATKAQNCQNRKINRNNKSGIKGVSWDKTRGKWRASLRSLGKNYFVGLYDDISKAKEDIDKKRSDLHGEFSRYL